MSDEWKQPLANASVSVTQHAPSLLTSLQRYPHSSLITHYSLLITHYSLLCFHPSAFIPPHARDSVVVENLFDLRAAAFEEVFELLAERVVAAAQAHRDVEDEGQERQVNLRRDWPDPGRHPLAPGAGARRRPP